MSQLNEAQTNAPTGNATVTERTPSGATLPSLDAATTVLVRLAALLAGGSEVSVRAALRSAVGRDVPGTPGTPGTPADLGDMIGGLHPVDPVWVEEVILQTYLFAGFPRALNAAREWRRVSGRAAPTYDEGERVDGEAWTARGEATCATVYGPFYTRLRHNIRELHPALDAWMIVEGYGKVLGRPQLDLWRRELCVVAACAMAGQDRQLHSHLHGALHAGASVAQVEAALVAINDLLNPEDARRYQALWARVKGA